MRWTPLRIAGIIALAFIFGATYIFGAGWPQLLIYGAVLAGSFVVSILSLDVLIPKLIQAGITGKDENKPDAPEIPEMGGLAILAGFSAGSLFAIALYVISPTFNLIYLLAAVITIQIIGFIGLADDLLSLPQWLKAILPLFAAVPLIAVRAGTTAINIPFIGLVDFGMVYILVLVPIAIAVCSNLTNMLAGFNGLEAGMGIVMFATLSALAISSQSYAMLLISLPMLGALLGFLVFNRYPAKVFPGDVGTLTIGVALATAVIIGRYESAGAILMIPYVLDFFVKAANRFPHTHQELKDGKMHPKDGRVRGLVHVVMKGFKGITEPDLVLFFVGMEILFAAIAIGLYFKF